MATITIPKKLMKDADLVVIPRKEYEKYLFLSDAISKSQRWFWTKEWQEGEREADEAISSGHISKPYRTKVELKVALDAMKR